MTRFKEKQTAPSLLSLPPPPTGLSGCVPHSPPLHKVDQLVPICERRGASASRLVRVRTVLGPDSSPPPPISVRRGEGSRGRESRGWEEEGGGDSIFLGDIFNRTATTVLQPEKARTDSFIAGLFQFDQICARLFLSICGSLVISIRK